MPAQDQPVLTWVEKFVGVDTRIVCQLAPQAGHTPLTYLVERDDVPDKGPFSTFAEALAVANQIATHATTSHEVHCEAVA